MGVGTAGGFFVKAPALEVGHMAEAAGLDVLVGHLDDAFGANGFPGEVFAVAPAALCAGHAVFLILAVGAILFPIAPGVMGEGVFAVRREDLNQFAAFRGGEAGADAYVLKGSGVVKQPQEQRAYLLALRAFVPAEASDDAVAVALVLDFEQDAFVGLVAVVHRLGHYAVEPCTFEALEPVQGDGTIVRGGGEVEGRHGVLEGRLQLLSTLLEGDGAQIAVVDSEEIEEDDGRRRLLGQELDAGSGGVDAELEGIEVEAPLPRDDQFAVEHAARRKLSAQRFEHLGEVAIEGLLFPALHEYFVAVAKYQNAKTIPLGLEDPVAVLGHSINSLGEHGKERRLDGQVHRGRHRVASRRTKRAE